jgi:hypothetical protein
MMSPPELVHRKQNLGIVKGEWLAGIFILECGDLSPLWSAAA